MQIRDALKAKIICTSRKVVNEIRLWLPPDDQSRRANQQLAAVSLQIEMVEACSSINQAVLMDEEKEA